MTCSARTVGLVAVLIAVVLAAGCGRRNRGGDEPSPTQDPAAITATTSASPAGGDADPTLAASPSPAASPTAAPATPTAPTAACASLPSGLTPGQTTVSTVTIDGVERSYRIHIPAGATSTAGMPLVLNFHGLGSSAAEQEPYSGFLPLSDSEGFVLLTPDGSGNPRGWVLGVTNNPPEDDLDLVDTLLDTMVAELCIDASRVYSTGMSNGAFFSSLLGCIRSDRIAAIAPVAGLAWSEGLSCGRPVPVLAFHGVEDAVVPFYGGEIFGIIPYDGAPLGIAGWAGHNRCAEAAPVQDKLAEHVETVRYEGCAAATQLIAITDGGHTWPGAIPVPRLGPTNREISAAELIWAFFKDKRVQ